MSLSQITNNNYQTLSSFLNITPITSTTCSICFTAPLGAQRRSKLLRQFKLKGIKILFQDRNHIVFHNLDIFTNLLFNLNKLNTKFKIVHLTHIKIGRGFIAAAVLENMLKEFVADGLEQYIFNRDDHIAFHIFAVAVDIIDIVDLLNVPVGEEENWI